MQLQPRPHSATVEKAALAEQFTPLQAAVLSRRVTDAQLFAAGSVTGVLRPPLARVADPRGLPDLDIAVRRIAKAMIERETVAIAVDHDCDGQTSLAVIRTALIECFGASEDHVIGFCTHRASEGYGLSEAFVARVMAHEPKVSLVITADQGSNWSDEKAIAQLQAAGIDTIVTDHHAIAEEGPPRSALACITPQRADSTYPDRHIAGCGVAWLVMVALRNHLIAIGRLRKGEGSVAGLLSFVALGTVADCTSLSRSPFNRAVVEKGLEIINARAQPVWRHLWKTLRREGDDRPFTSEDLAWKCGPLINARGRMGEAMGGVNFLTAATDEDAAYWGEMLHADNESRKDVERAMRNAAVEVAREKVAEGRAGLSIPMYDGFAGVHGIVSSRVTALFGRPTICLSPKQPYTGIYSGSVRSVEGVDAKKALDVINTRIAPGLLLKHGGHPAAAGLSVDATRLAELERAWDAAVREQVPLDRLAPSIKVDADIPPPCTVEAAEELARLDPWGREFEAPVFVTDVAVLDARPIGDGTHLAYQVRMPDGKVCKAVHFSAREAHEAGRPIEGASHVRMAYSLSINMYKGAASAQLMVMAPLIPMAK
jgi:single-stranded-DNA-specific exonuclease